jgi:hypothetical protein
MSWKIALGLTLVAIAPLSAQRRDRRTDVRVDVPPVTVDVPRIKVDIPPINVAIPAINVNLPRILIDDEFLKIDIPPINIDAPRSHLNTREINIDIPGFRIDLSDISEAVNEAVRESMESLRDWDFDMDHDMRMHRKGRVRDLMREWRDAVRSAEDSNDWEAADDLARELTRAAKGVNMNGPMIRHAPRGSTRS